MECHWELREDSIHLRQGWLSVYMCVPAADMLKCVGKKKRGDPFLHNGKGFYFLHFSLFFFFFHTKCSGLRNLFYFILFKFKLNEATSPF